MRMRHDWILIGLTVGLSGLVVKLVHVFDWGVAGMYGGGFLMVCAIMALKLFLEIRDGSIKRLDRNQSASSELGLTPKP